MVRVDLESLKKPSPSKWFYPLSLLREDGHELVCQSSLPRAETREFLRENHLLELFDNILYNPTEPPSITDLRHLPPLCRRQWTRTRLTFCISFSEL